MAVKSKSWVVIAKDAGFRKRLDRIVAEAEAITRRAGGHAAVRSILLGPDEMAQYAAMWLDLGVDVYNVQPGAANFFGGYEVKVKWLPGMDLELDPRFSANFVALDEKKG